MLDVYDIFAVNVDLKLSTAKSAVMTVGLVLHRFYPDKI